MKMALLHCAMFTPLANGSWGLPLLFEGEPGTGKSAIIEAYAARCGLPCEVLSPGERGEGAFGVVPVPVKQTDGTRVLTYPAPEWTQPMEGDAGGLVFVDEANTGGVALQPALMGLIHARRIGGKQLGPRVRVLGAINPPELAANGSDLAPPIANRFGWIRWGAPTVEEHTAYMLGQAGGASDAKVDALAEERRVKAAWGEAYAKAVGLETSFLGAQSDWKNKCPKANDPNVARAWPSDRSWENATRALAGAYVHRLTATERDELVTAFVGHKAYEAFATFIEAQDLPNVADLLDGKITFKHENKRLDRTAAVLNSAVAMITPGTAKLRVERSIALWKLLDTVGGSALDLIVPPTQSLIQANLHAGSADLNKAAMPVLAKAHPVLSASNMGGGRR